ncbi:MAG: hypothetical protein H6737_21705 [Alphaproteobacteria bacterium]|nr:hypothetical protein [Alphaproteobacteria bacterium]
MSDALTTTGPADPTAMPDPIQLFKETFDSFTKDDLGPYLLAGLGQFAVVVPVVLVLIFVLYFGMFAWIFGGFFAFAFVAAFGVELLGEDLGVMLGFVGMMLWYAAGFAGLLGISAAIGAGMAPMQASLSRRIAAYQREKKTLDFSAAFSDVGQDVVPVMIVALVVGMLVAVGAMFMYLPGLIAYALFGHAALLVALNRYSAFDALKTSAKSVMAHGSYYGMFWVLYFACAMVAAYIPIVGPMFLVAVHIRAHRHIFGDEVKA